MSINDFCHFWNFHYNGKNWRLTALWGLFVALKVYTFLKQIIQTWIEPIFGVPLKVIKSVCINNHIKEIFTVQLTTDMSLSSI